MTTSEQSTTLHECATELADIASKLGLPRLGDTILSETTRRLDHAQLRVLVLGETGTGKELAAEAIAEHLGRRPLVPINVGAVPTGVFEAQLFGHVQGAFSDARKASRVLPLDMRLDLIRAALAVGAHGFVIELSKVENPHTLSKLFDEWLKALQGSQHE